MRSVSYSRPFAFICGLISFLPVAHSQPRKVTDAEVQKITKTTLLIDTHNDITSRTVDGYDIGTAQERRAHQRHGAQGRRRGRAVLRRLRLRRAT